MSGFIRILKAIAISTQNSKYSQEIKLLYHAANNASVKTEDSQYLSQP